MVRLGGIRRLLVANRGEIAIRVFRAANELGIRTFAVYAEEDRLSLHRFKADESYCIGKGCGPVGAYLSISDILTVARRCCVDAIHPGYGFLSERPDFAQACTDAGILFVGPPSSVMRRLGDKLEARRLAEEAGVRALPATETLSQDIALAHKQVSEVGYPLMLKAVWGGGGRGMRRVFTRDSLEEHLLISRREAKSAFGEGDIYGERFLPRARHVEVQLLGDRYGNYVHLFERDCSLQRRHQKVVERAPAPYLSLEKREELCAAGLRIVRASGCIGAATAEFLLDRDSGEFFFIEVNPRIQVEHTVTEEVTGIDIVKAQIRIVQGGRIGDLSSSGVPSQEFVRCHGHALQCRITSEDPEANFQPDYGRITAYRGATGFGIRLDGGTAYSGALITRHYDSLLEKVTAWAPTAEEAVRRMDRALREFRIRGVATNLIFLESLINHARFASGDYTTRFIDETADLFQFARRRDRATRLLRFIAEVSVNGNPEMRDRPRPVARVSPLPPAPAASGGVPFGGSAFEEARCRAASSRETSSADIPSGSRDRLRAMGAKAFSEWVYAQKEVFFTDTTLRDAHQSLLATRMRSYDMLAASDVYAREFSALFSLECWGGATFDVALRFLQECPWIRLRTLRKRIPNILFQMLLRGANGVGYTNYPDNVVRYFILQASEAGVDVFRVFDSLNWVENMRVAMDAVLESGSLLEATICYSGDLGNSRRSKYDLSYYIELGRSLSSAGAHFLAIKDMAGILKPSAAGILVRALREETGLPVHFHTHDTGGIAVASTLAAIDSGADVVDAAMDSFSGLTSQASLGSLVAALSGGCRSGHVSEASIRRLSNYWESVRKQYTPFESDLRSSASEVWIHEMPGGQFTNLREQARSLGLGSRWHEVAQAYAEVNRMFGDIIKVTPTSKVVGDMALAMVSNNLSRADVEDPDVEVSFPDSVVSFFRGELGQPFGGFPQALQEKVLRNSAGAAFEVRPGVLLEATDICAERKVVEERLGRAVRFGELASHLMYPKVFAEHVVFRKKYGPVEVLPTPVFFEGMQAGEETSVELEPGKTLVIRCQAIGEADSEGYVRVFFELNGQPRTIKVSSRHATPVVVRRVQAHDDDADHISAPLPGVIASVHISAGRRVRVGDLLFSIEAMKLETAVHAEREGIVSEVLVSLGDQVETKDLLAVFAHGDSK